MQSLTGLVFVFCSFFQNTEICNFEFLQLSDSVPTLKMWPRSPEVLGMGKPHEYYYHAVTFTFIAFKVCMKSLQTGTFFTRPVGRPNIDHYRLTFLPESKCEFLSVLLFIYFILFLFFPGAVQLLLYEKIP